MKDFWAIVRGWGVEEQVLVLGGCFLSFLITVGFIVYWVLQLIATIHGVKLQ